MNHTEQDKERLDRVVPTSMAASDAAAEAVLPATWLVGGAGRRRGVLGMRLLMLLQVLGAFEGLSAVTAPVWLHRHMHANVRRDVVALDGLDGASVPLAVEAQVVGASPPDMLFAQVLLDHTSRVSERRGLWSDRRGQRSDCYVIGVTGDHGRRP